MTCALAVTQHGDLAGIALTDKDIAIGRGQKTAGIGQMIGEIDTVKPLGASGITPAGRGMMVLLLATAGVT